MVGLPGLWSRRPRCPGLFVHTQPTGAAGTGRRRQGTSDEPDRHAGPKVELEERWQRADNAIVNAADDIEGVADRRARSKRFVRGDRTGGSPVAPTGVPKGDHVVNPVDADVGNAQREPTDRG